MGQRIAVGVVIVVLIGIATYLKVSLRTDDATGATGRAAPATGDHPAQDRAAPPAAPSIPDETAADGSARAPGRGTGSGRAVREAVNGFGVPDPMRVMPERYELDLTGGFAMVNLHGGHSEGFPAASPDAPPTHALTGRVVDSGGAPIAGAIVLADQRLWIHNGDVMATAGVRTGADGTFTLAAQATTAVALAIDPRGWSALTPVVAGTTEPLTLVIAGRAGVAGTLTYNGHGESFLLNFTSVAMPGAFLFNYESAGDGTFGIAALPPGAYTVSIGLAQPVGTMSASARVQRDATLAPGQTARVDAALVSAAMLSLTAVVPGKPAFIVAYALTAPPVPATPAELAARGKARGLLVGGADAQAPVEIQDVTPGSYVACATADKDRAFGCVPVEVHDGDPPRDVEIPLVALPPAAPAP